MTHPPSVMPPPVLLRSPLLAGIGVPHGFSTRVGGVSSAPFASLNFGNPGDLPPERRDPPDRIAANWTRLLGALSQPGEREGVTRSVVQVHQVHGCAVHTVIRGGLAHAGASETKADAIVTDDPARVVAVRVADCTPVLVASNDGAVVAAIHAGWRGVVGGVVPGAIDAMRALSSSSTGRGLSAAIGPCIGPGAFEVGPEVAEEFWKCFGSRTAHVLPAVVPGKWLVDLKGAIKEQLQRAGVKEIDVIPGCTASDDADGGWFFSHRRDRGVTGRMVGVIGPR